MFFSALLLGLLTEVDVLYGDFDELEYFNSDTVHSHWPTLDLCRPKMLIDEYAIDLISD